MMNPGHDETGASDGGSSAGTSRGRVQPTGHGEPDHRRVPAGGCPVTGADAAMAHLTGFEEARALLRARGATTQAGFTAEAIPEWLFARRPVLFSDGPGHDAQRRELGRFFTPSAVDRHYSATMRHSAQTLIAAAAARGSCALEDLCLLYTVAVVREAVGVTGAPLPALARRLERFTRQPPFDLTKPSLGRTARHWATAAARGLGPLGAFYLRDVRPAIAERRRRPRHDLISHMLAHGRSPAEILMESATYASAGMVTTREFVVLACWHLLRDPLLGARFREGGHEEKSAILYELIRLEPVVGHLYRRLRTTVRLPGGTVLAPGTLASVCVGGANADAADQNPNGLQPGRRLRQGNGPAGLSFGAGEHRCPGEHLAITETSVFLDELLSREPRLRTKPAVSWEPLVAGYRLRGATLGFPASTA